MREIKFRQWIGKEFMIWGVGIDGNTFVGPASGGSVNASTTPHQQFTGLRDKNGKDIFEGDILSWVPVESRKFNKPFAPWVVIWNDKEARFSDWSPREEAEVIGNVYETPDLIKS